MPSQLLVDPHTPIRLPTDPNNPTLRPHSPPPYWCPQPTLTETQLWAKATTKATIVQHAHDTFNACLSITKTKAELIQLYLNLVAN